MPVFTAQLLLPQANNLVDVNAFFGLNQSDIQASNYDVISGEIYNILTTAIGEETFEPTYGSELPNRLFDPHDAITEQLMRTDIVLALERWVEPKITVDLANTSISGDPDSRAWVFNIAFVIPNLGPGTVSIQFNY